MKTMIQPGKTLKKTEETSNLESEDPEESRKRKLPARLISESDNDTDIESDSEGKTLIAIQFKIPVNQI